PDLLLTGVGMQKLFHNTGAGKFEDVTPKATLDKLTSVCLGASFLDLDQDSDLDLLICELAARPEEAVKLLKGEKAASSGELAVYLHVGSAPEVQSPTDKAPPLDCKFKKTPISGWQGPPSPLVGLAASDMDSDRDLDFLILGEHAAPGVIINDRLLQFR